MLLGTEFGAMRRGNNSHVWKAVIHKRSTSRHRRTDETGEYD